MSKEGVYHLILENPTLNAKAQNLYVRFEALNKKITSGTAPLSVASEINALKRDINDTRNIIKSWKI